MIIDHPRLKVRDEHAWEGYRACQVVQCDFCRRISPGHGCDAGEAADEARKFGFVTVRRGLGAPLLWTCGCFVRQVMER